MKKTLLIVSLFFTLMVKGQVNYNLGIGSSTLKSPTIETYLGYHLKGLLVNVGFVAHVTNDAGKGAIFYGKLGYRYVSNDTWSFEAAGGMGNHFRSADDKALNTKTFIGSVYAIYQMPNVPQGALFAGINYTKEVTTFNAGIRFQFVNDWRRGGNNGCYSNW